MENEKKIYSSVYGSVPSSEIRRGSPGQEPKEGTIFSSVYGTYDKNELNQVHQEVKTYNNPDAVFESIVKSIGRGVKNVAVQQGSNIKALATGEVSMGDVAREIPGNVIGGTKAVANVILPGLYKYVETTMSTFGEGLVYAFDKNARERYLEGNLDIFPTLTEATPKKVALYTIAAGLETTIIAKIPPLTKLGWKARAGYGAIDGMGFAISEGIAWDRSAEDIIKTMPFYGVAGSTIGLLTPYLLPLLKRELSQVPKGMREMFRQLHDEIRPPAPRQLSATSLTPEPTRIPISTPNARYEAYLRRMGYEPYIPDELLPTIDAGRVASRVTDDMIEVGTPLTPSGNPGSRGTMYEPYTPDSDLPTIGFDRTTRSSVTQATPTPTSDLRMVPEPRFRDVSNSTQGEAFTSAPTTRQTDEVTGAVAARESATDQVVPAEFRMEPVEVPMPVEVQKASMPVGTGERQVSRLAAEVLEDVDVIRRTSPERAERMGIATYQQANLADQARMAARLVETDVELALRIAKGEASVPGLLDNAVVMALARQARITGDSRLAIRTASLRATRMGQELAALRRDGGLGDDPVEIIAEVLQKRKERAGSGVGEITPTQKRENFEVKKRTLVERAKKVVDSAQLKMAEAQKVIDDIIC
jgi:hypothetical protein